MRNPFTPFHFHLVFHAITPPILLIYISTSINIPRNDNPNPSKAKQCDLFFLSSLTTLRIRLPLHFLSARTTFIAVPAVLPAFLRTSFPVVNLVIANLSAAFRALRAIAFGRLPAFLRTSIPVVNLVIANLSAALRALRVIAFGRQPAFLRTSIPVVNLVIAIVATSTTVATPPRTELIGRSNLHAAAKRTDLNAWLLNLDYAAFAVLGPDMFLRNRPTKR
jgi:hypothetical protein